MGTMTPDKLREAATLLATAHIDRTDDDMNAAADAWDADLLAKDNLECILDAAKEHIGTLERENQAYRDYLAKLYDVRIVSGGDTNLAGKK